VGGAVSEGPFRLDGRIALVTGAAGHLGRAMTSALCEAGCEVVLSGRSIEALDQLARELEASGHSASVQGMDVTDEAQVAGAIAAVEDRHGRLDVLVNNAHHGSPARFEASTDAAFEAAHRVAVTSAFRLVWVALPLLERGGRDREGGASVVNVASMYATVSPDPRVYGESGMDSAPYYGAAKAGLLQLTRHLACHLAPRRIRVNALSPGAFPPTHVIEAHPDLHRRLCERAPLGRTGVPGEVAGPLLFLASDASSFVTGINLPVDGGWTAW
jgi:NAD(P)-dependent dehydrogenase (short-subunit alcohol dehydrogenase family)